MSAYWDNRMAEVMLAGQARAEAVADQMQAMYAQASEYIAEQSRALFESFQRNYGLTEAEARNLLGNVLSRDESIRDAMIIGLQNTSSADPLHQAWLADLDSASFRARIQHWEDVQNSLDAALVDLAYAQEEMTGECYEGIANEAYYRTMYNISRESGYGFSFSAISRQDIQAICSTPFFGTNYSDRIWANTEAVAEKVKEELMLGVLTGKSYENMTQVIAEQMGSAAYQARRLVRTEGAFVSNLAEQESYKEAGVEKWRYIATLDSRTCEDCGQFDGKEYDTGDMEHMPPRHPNCRCTTGARLSEAELKKLERRAVDPSTGERILVPANMTYPEWYEKYAVPSLPPEQQISFYQGRQAEIQQAMSSLNSKTYEGIWKDPKHASDYASIIANNPNAIQGKLDYFSERKAAGDTSKDWDKLMRQTRDFERRGLRYEEQRHMLQDYTSKINELNRQLNPTEAQSQASSPFTADAYSAERKAAAVRARTAREADNVLRARTGEVWRNATQEQREAIYEYTSSYSDVNESLRGIRYGTNEFVGVGQINLSEVGTTGYGGRQVNQVLNKIDNITDIIEQSTYDRDMFFVRGCYSGGMANFFGQADLTDTELFNLSEAEMRARLIGMEPIEHGFMSMGSSSGTGFSGAYQFNIYAPQGTQMMYVEPFSHYGNGDKIRWDGVSQQRSFGSEDETLLQQGTRFRITDVKQEYGTWNIDMEVISQNWDDRQTSSAGDWLTNFFGEVWRE